MRNSQKLTFLQLAVLANQGAVATAPEHLNTNAEFWRFVAAHSRTLISKLVACAQLQESLFLVRNWVADR